MAKPVRIRGVKPLEGFLVHLEFTDGSARAVDLEPYLHGPIFAPVRDDPLYFRSIRVDPDAGTIVWSNGADIDPDVLYNAWKPAWMEPNQPTPN